ncbi:TetR/AcrR family transcriptional regulator [Nitratireductor pacificus]|uniref:TetR family transcriptional regulator n=1 Tax=Nitratireductor pacificus pht-3B TaxID=391937 RepID=K2M948_9HYPH|nr:TetR/AcrR family transcriptional regulator [Nitratireductor pacificus]EKF18621.1 TetR family transcriptional regulator [Nitratireductor pacificus pht-3B]
MPSQQKNTRQLILDTALDIVETEGMKALTQPRIARLSGIRQSHLTYYFPRKAELYLALLDASHERAERTGGGEPPTLEAMLATLFFEPERMRFFLSILLEVGGDPDLLPVMRDHAAGLAAEIAARLGRGPDDPDILAFVDELRGFALRALMSPELARDGLGQLRTLAGKHGLTLDPPSGDP